MRHRLLLLVFLLSGIVCGAQAQGTSFKSAAKPDGFFELCLFAPGDYGSANWRIPALLCLDDGSLLLTCDRRKYNEADLPQDIDIVCRRSTDGGHTWSEPATIVEGNGVGHGYGDAALVQCQNGDVICAFAGGNGYFQSSEANPIRTYICRSTDGGKTWSRPVDVTSQLWGSKAINPTCRNYRACFFSSGNGLRLRRGDKAGRIMFAVPMLRSDEWVSDNFVVYSDDNGHTWQVSQMAYRGGDEAKLMELTDGRILLSTRQNGARGFNHSADGGETWGEQGRWNEMTTNACNGDLLRVMATDRGDSCNLLMHSIPNSMQREDVSIFVSRDEGATWTDPMPIVDGPSVYSSLTLLPDGSIGVLVEKNPSGACEIWFQRWPLEKALNKKLIEN